MKEIPAYIEDAAGAHDLGGFMLMTPPVSRRVSFLYEKGVVGARVGIRPRVTTAYSWGQVATYTRQHALHVDFDPHRAVVEHKEVITYNTVHTAEDQQEIAHGFEIHVPAEVMAGRQYFAWRHHKDTQKDPPLKEERTDAHIYSTITAHQLAPMRNELYAGETLNFGAIALKGDTITFDNRSWPHAPYSLLYTPGSRPLESELFSRQRPITEDTVKIMDDSMTHESIGANQVHNIGVLFAIYSELYGERWLSTQPRQNIVKPL